MGHLIRKDEAGDVQAAASLVSRIRASAGLSRSIVEKWLPSTPANDNDVEVASAMDNQFPLGRPPLLGIGAAPVNGETSIITEADRLIARKLGIKHGVHTAKVTRQSANAHHEEDEEFTHEEDEDSRSKQVGVPSKSKVLQNKPHPQVMARQLQLRKKRREKKHRQKVRFAEARAEKGEKSGTN